MQLTESAHPRLKASPYRCVFTTKRSLSDTTRITVRDWLPMPFFFCYYSYYGVRLVTCALFPPSDITRITVKDWLPVPFFPFCYYSYYGERLVTCAPFPLQILLVLQRETGYMCPFSPSDITRITATDWLPVPFFPFRYYSYYGERLVFKFVLIFYNLAPRYYGAL